ncbi:uncharacterized protein LOC136768379 [Amia ocellicauda]|uniref:uncharacterized protein LOC136768379 n=1 Tax=Amia ocellicauda TaxID=2972642 RepID=UPI003463872C
MGVGFELLLGVALLYMIPAWIMADTPPAGAIVSECRDRSFWVSIDRDFAGPDWRFDVKDGSVLHQLDEDTAAACGFTYSAFNLSERAIFRASYFACFIQNLEDEYFALDAAFVTISQSGRETSYPVQLNCTLSTPWYPREVVCEENYMEVSVITEVPSIPEGEIAGQSSNNILQARKEAKAQWHLSFLKGGGLEEPINLTYAHSLGFVVAPTFTRTVFRSPYNMSESEMVLVDNILVETINAIIYLNQMYSKKVIYVSTACTKDYGTFDGTYLYWNTPRVMLPLVVVSSTFEELSIQMGLEGQLLDSATMIQRGFKLQVIDPLVQLAFPYGAEGGYLESRVIDNHYNQHYILQLLFVNVWATNEEEVTYHSIIWPLATPFIPQTPFTINQTNPDDKIFTVYLGNFNPDVELKALNLNGVLLTIPQALARGFVVLEVPHTNNTHAYILEVPFNDSVVISDYLGKGMYHYILNINYTLNIIPQNDPYYHPASVEATEVYLPPEVTGKCMEDGIMFQVDQAAVGNVWLFYIGEDLITLQLVADRGYTLTNQSGFLVLEVPLFAIGFAYEEVSLAQFFGLVTLAVRHLKTLRVESFLTMRCPFTQELLACMPNGYMAVVALTTPAIPFVDASKTTLLDKTCLPQEADHSRAVFNISVSTCGTKRYFQGQYMIYENEVVYTPELYPVNAPIITRDSSYRLTFRCYFPINGTRTLYISRPLLPTMKGIPFLGVPDAIRRSKRPRAARGEFPVSRGHSARLESTPDSEDVSKVTPVLGMVIAVLGVLLLASIFIVKMRC